MNVDLVLLIVGAMMFGLGLLSSVLKRVFLTTALAALLLGVVLGPRVLGLVDPAADLESERQVLEALARITHPQRGHLQPQCQLRLPPRCRTGPTPYRPKQ